MAIEMSKGMIVERRRSRILASPRARRALRQRGIDPAAVHGSGPGGRIVEADVLRAAPADTRQGPGSVGGTSQFTLRVMADVTSLVEVQKQIAADVQRTCGTPLVFSDFLLRAMGLALAECPEANRVWQGQSPGARTTAHVGLQCDGPNARTTLVLPEVDRMALVDLVRRRAELLAAARAGQLPKGAAQGAATSLCDLTGQPVDECTAVFAPPQTSVLAAGRVAARPTASGNQLCLRQTVCLNLTADQRAISPENAAKWLGRIVELLEQPFLLLCERLRV